MWLELDSKKTSQFRNSPWLLKTFWNQDLNFVLLAYLSTIPGTGASENICTLIRTLGKATCLDFITEHFPNRWTSPYWFSIWVETIPKQWICFGILGIFLVVGSISVSGWMNGTVSFLPTLRTCVVMFVHMKAFSNPNQGLSMLLCWSYWGKNLYYCLKRKYIWSISRNWELCSNRV